MKDDVILQIKRVIFYLIIYIVVILICGTFISFFNLNLVSSENERYLISSIIQSQAAIISIVITLSLVAIQITASQYSSTIIDYIKRLPDFWILLITYIISIIYGLVILKTLDVGHDVLFLGVSSASYVSLEFGIAVYSLVILIPYFINTTTSLKSNVIIEDISQKIDKNSIISKDENFNLFFNIIESSMLKNDLEITTNGLVIINNTLIRSIQNASKEELDQILKSYFEKISRIQILSQNLNLDYITLYVCNSYYNIAEALLEQDSINSLDLQISSLYNIAKQATEKNSNLIFHSSLNFLTKIAFKSAKKEKHLEYEKAIESIRFLGQLSINYHNQNNFALCLEQLELLALFQIERDNEPELSKIILKFANLLEDAILQNFLSTLFDLSEVLGKIENEIISKDKKYEKSLIFISHNLKKICNSAINTAQIGVLQINIEHLQSLYFYSIQEKIDQLSMSSAYSINEILKNGIASINAGTIIFIGIQIQKKIAEHYLKQKEMKHFDVFINTNVLTSEYLIENRQEEILRNLISDLGEFHKKIIENNFENESLELTKFFYKVGKSLIENKIFDYSFIAPLKLLKEMKYSILSNDSPEKVSVIFLIIRILNDAGINASNKKLERTTEITVICLGHLYVLCAKEGYYMGQRSIQSCLLLIGFTSFEKGLKSAIISVIQQIEHISTSEKKMPEETFKHLIQLDLAFGMNAIENKDSDIATICAKQLADLPIDVKVHIDNEFSKLRQELIKDEEMNIYQQFKDLYLKIVSEKSSLLS